MRSRIAAAATACDYEALEKLAGEGGASFSFSLGAPAGGPAAHWRKLEAEASEGPLAFLVKGLSSPHGTMELQPLETHADSTAGATQTLYVWPAAATKDVPTDDDWAELERIYPKEQVERMKADSRKFGIGYLGYRAGITASGDWMYFVAGD